MTTILADPARRTHHLPPELPGRLPLLGHALSFRRNPVEFLQRGRERFGEIFSIRLLGNRVAVLASPRGSEAFFRASDEVLDPRAAYQFMVPIFGKGIAYGASPERMDEQLRFFLPAVTEQRLRTYAGYIHQEVESYIERMGEQGEVELLALTNELTVYIASRCLIGREFRQHLSTEFARLYHDLESALNLLGFFWPNLPLPAFRRRDRARVRLVEMIAGIIAERRKHGRQEEDVLQTLMEVRYADGSALSDDEITGLLLAMIFAGQHTSAVQAAWAGIELLRHPQYLEPVLAEQQTLLSSDGELTFETLRDMVLLERAIRESERLHPPLILLMRKVVRNFSFQDYVIPPGWLVMVSPAVSHRLAEVFAEPDRYDPTRRMDNLPKYATITFGGGRHGCIGMTFAYLQVKAIWSVLLRRFDLELVDRDPQPNYSTFVVGPKPPCRLRYRRKRRASQP